MTIEIEGSLSYEQKVWTGNSVKPRPQGTFYRFYRWLDNAGHPQITLCKNNGSKETYNPKYTLVELEYHPDGPFVDHFSTECISKTNLRIHPTYKFSTN